MKDESVIPQANFNYSSRVPGLLNFGDCIHGNPLNGRNVLILEDDALTASHLAYSIARNGGHIVGPAMCNAEAKEILLTSLVELAILDVDLIGETSFPIAELMMTEDIPFVFHSAAEPSVCKANFPGVPFLQKGMLHHCLIGRLVQHAQAVGQTTKRGSIAGAGYA